MYVELHAHSHFSFLDGASSPEALVTRAVELGMPALALTDHDGLYGAMRFWQAARERGLKAVIGAEVTLEGAGHLTVLAETQTGYSQLCRLILEAKLRGGPAPGLATGQESDETEWLGKTETRVTWAMLERWHSGLIALTGCRQGAVADRVWAG